MKTDFNIPLTPFFKVGKGVKRIQGRPLNRVLAILQPPT